MAILDEGLTKQGWEIADDERQRNIEEKQLHAQETARTAEKTENDLKYLQNTGAGVNNAGNRRKATEQIGSIQRQTLANAAENGWLRSRALDDARLLSARQRALALSGVSASEEQEVRTRIPMLAQQIQTTAENYREIPEKELAVQREEQSGDPRSSMWKGEVINAGWKPVFSDERSRSQASIDNSQTILAELSRNRPSAEQMRASFMGEATRSLQTIQEEMIADAQRRGMPQAYIDNIPARIAAEQQAVSDDIDRWVNVLTGPDPASIQAELAALYSPDKIEDVYQRRANPAWGILGGALGAVVGGVAGNAPGAMAGYSIGSGLGTVVGTSLEG